MKLEEFKNQLQTIETLNFMTENGEMVPAHFHITEVGEITKHFIDCGGKERIEKVVNFQLWNANDTDHQLMPQKVLNIITLSEKVLGIQNLDIEVEYQTETIGKYDLGFDGVNFILKSKQTACLASDSCGIPAEKQKIKLGEIVSKSCCTPGGGCC
ncbi:MAG: hypothetical protein HQ463_03500 [Bacteroidetes bacterium]|nr:hypothetical protein [Bacteroidota bacterium]